MKFILTSVICLLMIAIINNNAFTEEKENNTREIEYIKQNLKSNTMYITDSIENTDRIENFITGRWIDGQNAYEFYIDGTVKIIYIDGFDPSLSFKEIEKRERIEKGHWKLRGNELIIKIANNEFIYKIEKYYFEFDRRGIRKYSLMLYFKPPLYKAGNRLWRSFN